MTVDWNRGALEQLDWHWRSFVRPRLDGLTDDEYQWEPVPGCWSIRPRAEARAPGAVGAGALVLEDEEPPPRPAPVTTIAWRLGHLAADVFGIRASNHFGDGSMSRESIEWPATAAGALAFLDQSYDRWTTGVGSLDDAGMARAIGPAEGPFAEFPYAELVLHINREAIHHSAEILLLRDLYRARSAPTP